MAKILKVIMILEVEIVLDGVIELEVKLVVAAVERRDLIRTVKAQPDLCPFSSAESQHKAETWPVHYVSLCPLPFSWGIGRIIRRSRL